MDVFVDDPKVVGKWGFVGASKTKEEYLEGNISKDEIFDIKELYFLEGGKPYWVISWTKGFVKIAEMINPYEVEGEIMFISVIDRFDEKVNFIAVFKQIDNKKYTEDEIAKKEDLNLPFVNDNQLLGNWAVCDFVNNIKQFNPLQLRSDKKDLMYTNISVLTEGNLIKIFNNHTDRWGVKWTKGFLLNHNNKTASKYVIKKIDGKEYLFLEWKSGDYIYGGKISGYYVFERS